MIFFLSYSYRAGKKGDLRIFNLKRKKVGGGEGGGEKEEEEEGYSTALYVMNTDGQTDRQTYRL